MISIALARRAAAFAAAAEILRMQARARLVQYGPCLIRSFQFLFAHNASSRFTTDISFTSTDRPSIRAVSAVATVTGN